MSSDHSSGLLLGFQLEQAFALVGQTSLDAVPLVDELITQICDERLRSIEVGEMRWRNVGPRHAIGLAPRHALHGLYDARERVAAGLATLRHEAARLEARLLPTGMHPWLDPERAQLWPHGGDHVDQALIAFAGQARHGWANQQGLRLSLPFASENEFRDRFAALRFLSPLLPALAASSPFVGGELGPAMNCRLAAGRDFLGGGSLVPRAYAGKAAYEAELLVPEAERIRKLGLKLGPLALCPHLLRVDFQAQQIHVDLLDGQECLEANLALCAFTAAATGWLVHETGAARDPWPSPRLAEILETSLISAEKGIITDRDYLAILGFPEGGACRTSELLQFLLEDTLAGDPAVAGCSAALGVMKRGSLATRMLTGLQESNGASFNSEELYNLYRDIARCSDENTMFPS